MTVGVIACAFGEPAEPDRPVALDYLERIFLQNADLDAPASDAEATRRARQLAERRLPGLLEEYEAIGGSPLNDQAAATAERVEAELRDRGYDVETVLGLQFTDPLLEDVVGAVRTADIDRLVGLPLYPVCGPSTTVAALERLRAAVESADADLDLVEVSGFHRHPAYARFRADAVASFCAERGVDLHDGATELVFSAHGTPQRYLEAGSRYRDYVEEVTAVQAAQLGVNDYTLGFQNHANRDVAWTQPEIESTLESIDADRLVVEPVSFLHEQSETLSELDRDLRSAAEAAGFAFHRVPVPHDDPRLTGILADVVEPAVAGFDPSAYNLRPCRCRDHPQTVCLNAPLAGSR